MRGIIALLVVACSSGKSRPAIEDAARPRIGDAALVGDGAAAPGHDAASAATTGDVQVRVEWKDVPVPARASPGRTACKTPRTPAVAPTTTWGIPDALVVVDNAPATAADVRVVLADCALSPRLSVGRTLAIASGGDRPTTVTFSRRGTLAALPAVEAGTPWKLQLPIAGHAVAPTVADGGLYEMTTGRDGETAWFVAHGSAAITDASGVILVKDVPAGKHAVRAWLPPRGAQPGRFARGEVSVEPGDLAELTLQLE